MRLQLRKQQAEAGDIILLYGDESEALTHPYLARAWAKTGADLRVPAPGQAKKVALLGSLDHAIRELVVHTSPTKRSSDFVAHLEQLDRLYGPKPGQPLTPVVLVEDNGPIHTSKLAMAALATRAHWLTVEWLPKYAPELNDIETVWRDLKAHHLAHQTFDDIDALDDAIHQAVDALNAERAAVPLARLRISALGMPISSCRTGAGGWFGMVTIPSARSRRGSGQSRWRSRRRAIVGRRRGLSVSAIRRRSCRNGRDGPRASMFSCRRFICAAFPPATFRRCWRLCSARMRPIFRPP